MFRGGDYVDQPKFYSNDGMPKNSLDVSVSLKILIYTQDIAGAKAKSNYPPRAGRDNMQTLDINGSKPPMYGGMPSMSPSMIGSTPAYAPPQRVNNVIFGNDDEFKKQLQRKGMYDPSTLPRNDDNRVAGVKYRPKTGERSISDVFNSQSDYPSKAADRSMNYQPYSDNGVQKNYSGDVAAGVRTGSPKRKNDSTVFAHLPVENTAADRSRRDPYEIQKPKHVHNNLSGAPAAPYDMPQMGGGNSAYEDELSRQFNEYYKMQQQMN